MLLQPKKTKFKKLHKNKLKKLEYSANSLGFGSIGLQALNSGCISSRQIEATRQSINRKLKRTGKIWIKIFPHISITAKPIEVRMGKGKGAVKHWVAKVKKGTVLFEIDGVPKKISYCSFSYRQCETTYKNKNYTKI